MRNPFMLASLLVAILLVVFVCLFVRTETTIDRKIIRYTMYKYEAYDRFRRQAGKDFQEDWNEAHPDEPILVKYEPISRYTQKINAEVVADTLHDLFFIPGGQFREYAEQGVLLPLDDYLTKHDDWKEIEKIYPQVIEQCRHNGKLYCLPGNLNTDALFYNKALFDRAGVPYPNETWTWRDVADAARKLTVRDAEERTVQFGLIFTNSLPYMMSQAGTRPFVGPDKTKVNLTDPATVEAITFFHNLVHVDRVSPSPAEALTEKGTDSFKNGHAAMIVGGRWYTTLFKPITDLDWRVAPPPIAFHGKRVSGIGFNMVAISARTRYPDTVYKLLLSLVSPRQIKNLVDEGDSIPLRMGTEANRYFLQDPTRPPGENLAYMRVFDDGEIIARTTMDTPVLKGSVINDEFKNIVEAIFASKASKSDTESESERIVRDILAPGQAKLQRAIDRELTPRPPASVGAFVLTLGIVASVLAGFGLLYVKTRPADMKKKASGGHDLRRSKWGYLFILPNICGFLLFTLLPVLFSLVLAFTEWNLLNWPPKFVGFRNFSQMLFAQDSHFWQYFWNTMYLMIGIPIGIAGSLLLAVVLNQKLKGRMFFRSVFFLPSFTAGVAIFMLWSWIFNAEAGLVNNLMKPGIEAVQRYAVGRSPIGLAGTMALLALLIGGAWYWRLVEAPALYGADPISKRARFWNVVGTLLAGGAVLALLGVVLAPLFGTRWLTESYGLSMLVLGVWLMGLLTALRYGNLFMPQGPTGPVHRPLPMLGLVWLSLGSVGTVVLAITAIRSPQLASGLVFKSAGGVLWAMVVWMALISAPNVLARWRSGEGTGVMATVSLGGVALVVLGGYFGGWMLMNLPAQAMAGMEPPKWLSALHEVSLGPLFAGATVKFDWAKPAFIIIGLWSGIGGFNMVLYLAGLQGINPELYEASAIDGASRWQQFKTVTWPLLSPTTFFIFIMSVIGGFQGGFQAAYIMTQGGPQRATTTLSYEIYTKAFEQFSMGYAAALAWFLFLLVFVITLFNWRFGGSQVHYD